MGQLPTPVKSHKIANPFCCISINSCWIFKSNISSPAAEPNVEMENPSFIDDVAIKTPFRSWISLLATFDDTGSTRVNCGPVGPIGVPGPRGITKLRLCSTDQSKCSLFHSS